MTPKQRAYQKSLLRKLHLSPRYVNVFKDDPIAYRAWLKKHLGVDSSKELKLEVLIELVKYFEFKRDVMYLTMVLHLNSKRLYAICGANMLHTKMKRAF